MSKYPELDLAPSWNQLLIPDAGKQLQHTQVALVKYLAFFKPMAEEQLLKNEPDSHIDEIKIKYFVIGEQPADG